MLVKIEKNMLNACYYNLLIVKIVYYPWYVSVLLLMRKKQYSLTRMRKSAAAMRCWYVASSCANSSLVFRFS